MHAFWRNHHSQVFQIPPSFRHGHEQDQQITAFCLAALTPMSAVSNMATSEHGPQQMLLYK
jgi:hypothetical protein